LRTAIITIVLILGFPRSARVDSKTVINILTACAAFGPDGGWATVTVDARKVTLEITTGTGVVSSLSLPLRYPAPDNGPTGTRFYSCKAYFDNGNDLIAVAVSGGFPMRGLQVGVADTKQLKWTGDWGVEPTSGISQPSLSGFLQDTTSVVIAGEPSTKDGHGIQHGSLWTLLFDLHGQQLNSVPTQRNYSSASSDIPFFTDANHNRLWFFPCVLTDAPISRQPDCPVGWTTLTGDAAPSSEFNPRISGEKRADFWMRPNTIAAPNENTVFIADTVLGVHSIWLVDIQEHTLNRLTIPKRRHFPNFYETRGAAAVSRDGEVAAFSLAKGAVAFPYLTDNYVYTGEDIAVVQLHPLQLLGILAGGPFAVDHRGSKARVLVYRKDHWERHEFADTHS